MTLELKVKVKYTIRRTLFSILDKDVHILHNVFLWCVGDAKILDCQYDLGVHG